MQHNYFVSYEFKKKASAKNNEKAFVAVTSETPILTNQDTSNVAVFIYNMLKKNIAEDVGTPTILCISKLGVTYKNWFERLLNRS